ncbi:MAG: NCS1 family nucleobase:cation symporter-1 [Gemmatimonadetes bacterium]|nr:NCS1 family nucleobase:cation symporter-1 [Gemmatimonadota bacterium]
MRPRPASGTDFVTLEAPLPTGPLVNDDIAPTSMTARTWRRWHFVALWVAMSVCIPTYMLAASMIDAGMSWWQSLLTIQLGNVIVLVPMIVNAHAGTRYGIPFPVLARASFGWKGAHVASVARSIVACGWFGIQTWIGGLAVHAMLGFVFPGWNALGGETTFMGYTAGHYLGFFIFWLVNMHFAWHGTESIKRLETLAAPFLLLTGLALLAWALIGVGGLDAALRGSEVLGAGATAGETGTSFPRLFLPWLTAMVGYWATLSLNIPDFTRYAASQRDQAIGQAVGLLTTMPLFAFVGIVVTSATVLLFGEAIWNPIDLVTRLTAEGAPWLGFVAMAVLALATLSTNIAANVVAPANSFSNLAPRRIGFRAGGMIAGAIGILLFPWLLLDAYQTWLISYSGLLGAVGGIMICDYGWVRRFRLELRDLYSTTGAYEYDRGINRSALIALVVGVGVAIAGKLHPSLSFLFEGAWFSAAAASFVVYAWLMREERA